MQTETNRTIHKKLFFFVGKTCTKRLHLDLCWFAFFTSHRSQVIHRLLLFVLIEKITYFLHFIVFAVRSVPSHQCETMHSYKNTNNNLMYCMRMRHITRFFFFLFFSCLILHDRHLFLYHNLWGLSRRKIFLMSWLQTKKKMWYNENALTMDARSYYT